MSSESPFPRWMDRSNAEYNAALAADQAKEEEMIARSGDSGVVDDELKLDPWSSGEMAYIETKWLEQSLRRRSRELEPQVQHGEELEGSSWRRSLDRSLDRQAISPESSRTRSVHGGSVDLQSHEVGPSADTSSSSPSYGSDGNELQRPPGATFVPDVALNTGISTVPLPSDGRELPPSRLASGDTYPAKRYSCQRSLEYACTLAHLACFSILGVLIRYYLDVLFGDDLGVTLEGSALYRDLPPNMVGSFFMGWVGIVFKRDISLFSEPLAVGLSTGLMGSITTFASWNQKMVYLFTTGHMVPALAGYVIGMEIAQMSLLTGVDTGKALKRIVAKFQQDRVKKGLKAFSRPSLDSFHRRMVSFAIFSFISIFLWAAAVILMVKSESQRVLWLACIVAPPGVWARWHLARFNGRGFRSHLKWLPFGTLLANLSAASLATVLGLVQYMVADDNIPLLIGGLQLGFLGCLSTVSTFVAEVYTMHAGPMKLKAYIYTILTLVLALNLGIFFFSCPSWGKDYVNW